MNLKMYCHLQNEKIHDGDVITDTKDVSIVCINKDMFVLSIIILVK
jgi:hypothetical protein